MRTLSRSFSVSHMTESPTAMASTIERNLLRRQNPEGGCTTPFFDLHRFTMARIWSVGNG
jgi:hypothetical protein